MRWTHLTAQPTPTDLLYALFTVCFSLLCITLHELSHGLVAYSLGDDTAKKAGRLTLNPIRHIDPMGLLMMVALGFGWAKPVPVNMDKFKKPRLGMALTALAGPACNLVLGAVLLFVYGVLFYHLSDSENLVIQAFLDRLCRGAYLSLTLAIFNMLPISPLDGSKIAFSFLSDQHYNTLMRYERYGMILLLVLSYTGLIGNPLSKATGWVFDRLLPLALRGYDAASRLTSFHV